MTSSTSETLQQQYLDRLARAQEAATQEFALRTIDDVVFDDEPIQLVDAYRHCRIATVEDSSGARSSADPDDDAWLEEIGIPAARQFCELYKGMAFATRTLELATNAFPTVAIDTPPGPFIPLPFGPVQTITSITYTDVDGNSQTFADSGGSPLYELDVFSTPNRAITVYGESWPTARASANAIRVRYVTGFLRAPDSTGKAVIPKLAIAAIAVMLNHLYENRGIVAQGVVSELPFGVTSLLDLIPGQERLGMA